MPGRGLAGTLAPSPYSSPQLEQMPVPLAVFGVWMVVASMRSRIAHVGDNVQEVFQPSGQGAVPAATAMPSSVAA